jgi:hypothetical protein
MCGAALSSETEHVAAHLLPPSGKELYFHCTKHLHGTVFKIEFDVLTVNTL